MTTTTFQNGVTLTDEDWFNDVDFLVYDIFGDSGTTASAAARIQSGITSLGPIQFTSTISVSAGAVFAAVQVGGVLSVSAQATMVNLAVGGTLSLSAGVAGAAVATQANMESAASTGSTSLIVTPGRLQYHPGVAKGWVRFDGSATSVTAAAAYNVSSITDNGTGSYTVFWSTAFSSSNYAVDVASNLNNSRVASISTNSAQVVFLDLSGTAADASIVSIIVFGDQ
jgi:hypothetical protein